MFRPYDEIISTDWRDEEYLHIETCADRCYSCCDSLTPEQHFREFGYCSGNEEPDQIESTDSNLDVQ